MDWVYRGLYLIGDKKTGRITNVQVFRLPFISRAASSRTQKQIPWKEDIKETPGSVP